MKVLCNSLYILYKMDENREDENRENKNRNDYESPVLPTVNILLFLLNTLLGFYAIYISFKVNKGISWGIIPALFFPIIYLIYIYSKYGKSAFQKKRSFF